MREEDESVTREGSGLHETGAMSQGNKLLKFHTVYTIPRASKRLQFSTIFWPLNTNAKGRYLTPNPNLPHNIILLTIITV